MTTTHETPTSLPAPGVAAPALVDQDTFATIAAQLTEQRLRHYGHTDEQVAAAMTPADHAAAGCEFENWNWVCLDEDDQPRHAAADQGAEARRVRRLGPRGAHPHHPPDRRDRPRRGRR